MTPDGSAGPHAEPTDEELVARAWSGDDTALDAVLERYRDFVRGKARSYFLVGGDAEDVVQEGMIGLYKAIRDFDPTKLSSFRSFADLCVTRQIITAIKSATRHKHGPLNTYVSMHTSAGGDDDAGTQMADTFVAEGADPATSVISSHELAVLEEYFSEVLSGLEVEVLHRYVAGQSYSEIAAELDRHVKSIDNALQRIKRKLDSYLEERRLTEAV